MKTEYNTDNIDRAFALTMELEGLLVLVRSREEMTPGLVYDMIKEKLREISALFSDDDEVIASVEFEETRDADITADEAVLPEEEASLITSIENDPQPMVSDPIEADYAAAVEIEQSEEAGTTDSSDKVDVEVDQHFDPVFFADPEEDEIAIAAEYEQSEDAAEVDFDDDYSPLESISILPEMDSDSDAIRTDEFMRHLTINDKYLFLRELFGNSSEMFNSTVATLMSLGNMDEVEEYLYNDLCFSSENEVVKSFVASVAKILENK